jgi:hypothetical protein
MKIFSYGELGICGTIASLALWQGDEKLIFFVLRLWERKVDVVVVENSGKNIEENREICSEIGLRFLEMTSQSWVPEVSRWILLEVFDVPRLIRNEILKSFSSIHQKLLNRSQ